MAEGARLESVYTATYRGFESLSLRQIQKNRPCGGFFVSARLVSIAIIPPGGSLKIRLIGKYQGRCDIAFCSGAFLPSNKTNKDRLCLSEFYR